MKGRINTSYYRESDGHTYWFEGDVLVAAPTFTNGEPDLDNISAVCDFAEPLTATEEKKITDKLAAIAAVKNAARSL